MPVQDVHKRITELESRIAKLEGIKRKAQTLKADVKKKGDQRKAKAIAETLKK